ncbi:hypothetical protein KIN20_026816 [Parelaphostrongylus tenuis]|uniref:Uncharacterized protein n=1 Tax=Parelaphostrongylus tenuis TaxID=148309 RepID=A0AAD5WD83_PARTN|nr:hypothetical protein KIN20_026816 [Parelaphostrongylus tenuis]
MANWSRIMWQDVMNRALRMLASGPFGLRVQLSPQGTVLLMSCGRVKTASCLVLYKCQYRSHE